MCGGLGGDPHRARQAMSWVLMGWVRRRGNCLVKKMVETDSAMVFGRRCSWCCPGSCGKEPRLRGMGINSSYSKGASSRAKDLR